jgi:hypothetical protein
MGGGGFRGWWEIRTRRKHGEHVSVRSTFREKLRLRVFENRVLRMISGPKRDEVTGEWRRLHNKELYALYSSPDIIWVFKSRTLKCAGHVVRREEAEVLS